MGFGIGVYEGHIVRALVNVVGMRKMYVVS